MCIVAIAWQVFDDLPLVLLSNRDEVLNRPTLNAHQWEDMPIFAGRDQLSHGTWLGHYSNSLIRDKTKTSKLNTPNKNIVKENNTRWATVLNFREITKSDNTKPVSRGKLITEFLTSNLSPMQFAKQIKLADYAGFNLLVGNDKQAVLINNRGYAPTILHSGLHVISNGQPNEKWFKCERLNMRVFQELLPLIKQGLFDTSRNDKALPDPDWKNIALDILKDKVKAPVTALPNTGIPKPLEQALSSIYISPDQPEFMSNYGTRTHSILLLKENKFKLLEETCHN